MVEEGGPDPTRQVPDGADRESRHCWARLANHLQDVSVEPPLGLQFYRRRRTSLDVTCPGDPPPQAGTIEPGKARVTRGLPAGLLQHRDRPESEGACRGTALGDRGATPGACSVGPGETAIAFLWTPQLPSS